MLYRALAIILAFSAWLAIYYLVWTVGTLWEAAASVGGSL